MPSNDDGADVVLVTGVSGRFGGVIARTSPVAGYRVFAGMRDIDGRNRAACVPKSPDWAPAKTSASRSSNST